MKGFFQRRIAPCDDALTYIALGVDKTDFIQITLFSVRLNFLLETTTFL